MIGVKKKPKGLVNPRKFDMEPLKKSSDFVARERNWPSSKYFADLEIPDDWEDVEEFANWYMANRMPWMIPWEAEVICSDDATAIALFRKGRYQVELYLVHPDKAVPSHSHPGMESVIIRLGAGETSRRLDNGLSEVWGAMAPVLHSGEIHGGRPLGFSQKGYAMLTFEQWPEDAEVTSAAVLWRGYTAGPKQDAIIRRYLPDAFVKDGFADVTQGHDGAIPKDFHSIPLAEGEDMIDSTEV